MIFLIRAAYYLANLKSCTNIVFYQITKLCKELQCENIWEQHKQMILFLKYIYKYRFQEVAEKCVYQIPHVFYNFSNFKIFEKRVYIKFFSHFSVIFKVLVVFLKLRKNFLNLSFLKILKYVFNKCFRHFSELISKIWTTLFNWKSSKL